MAETYDRPFEDGAAKSGSLTAIIIGVVALIGLAGLGALYYAGTLDRMFGVGPYAAPSDPAAGDMASARPGKGAAPTPAPAPTPAETPANRAATAEAPAEPTAPEAEVPMAEASIEGRWCANGSQITFNRASGTMTTSGEAGNSSGRFAIDGQSLTISDGDNSIEGTAMLDGANVLVLTMQGNERRFERC